MFILLTRSQSFRISNLRLAPVLDECFYFITSSEFNRISSVVTDKISNKASVQFWDRDFLSKGLN